MLINCELPISMLQMNDELNDFDFILLHLMLSDPGYRDYYMSRVGNGRATILDCSAYEFYVKGQDVPLGEYRDVIEKLHPTAYILPDKLMDKERTIVQSIPFAESMKYNASLPIGVLQGNSVDDFVQCAMRYYSAHIRCVAIPFHNTFFKGIDLPSAFDAFTRLSQYYDTDTKAMMVEDIQYAAGRYSTVQSIRCVLRQFDYVHLLGSHCPFEKALYTDGLIKSMDTGYPVKCGIAGYTLGKEPGKPNIILDDFLNDDLTDNQVKRIRNNIIKFKDI